MKPEYKIWDWELTSRPVPASMNPTGKTRLWYCLVGISDQYEGGKSVRTSKIIRIDFESGVCETQNSIYRMMNYPPQESTK